MEEVIDEVKQILDTNGENGIDALINKYQEQANAEVPIDAWSAMFGRVASVQRSKQKAGKFVSELKTAKEVFESIKEEYESKQTIERWQKGEEMPNSIKSKLVRTLKDEITEVENMQKSCNDLVSKINEQKQNREDDDEEGGAELETIGLNIPEITYESVNNREEFTQAIKQIEDSKQMLVDSARRLLKSQDEVGSQTIGGSETATELSDEEDSWKSIKEKLTAQGKGVQKEITTLKKSKGKQSKKSQK